MQHEEDFVNESLISFEIEGKKFVYKPATAGDETEWMEEYMEVGEDNKPKQNLSKITQCKLRNLKQVPYDQELINKIINVHKSWELLNKDQRNVWTIYSRAVKGINKLNTEQR